MAAPSTPEDGTPSSAPIPSAATAASPTKAHIGAIEGQGPFAQFIVRYRDGSPTFGNPATVPARASAAAASSGLTGVDRKPLQLLWQRRLGVGADVVRVERPLDRDEASRLMQAFAADPEVEYIEIDGIVTHQSRAGI